MMYKSLGLGYGGLYLCKLVPIRVNACEASQQGVLANHT